MGGLLAKGEVSRGAVDAHVAPGAVQARVEHGAAQAFTRADMRVLGVQQGAFRGMETGAMSGLGAATGAFQTQGIAPQGIQATGIEENGVNFCGVGMEKGAINALGVQDGAVRVAGIGAANGAFQTLGIAPDAIRVTGMEKDAINIGGDGFFMMIVACSAVALSIIVTIFTNLPPGPYPWIFLITFFVLIIFGALVYRKMELDKINKENATKRHQASAIRAIGQRFEMQRQTYQQIQNESRDSSSEEVRQILSNMDHTILHLNQSYLRCLNGIQSHQNEAVYEQEMSNFFHQADEHHQRMEASAREIKRWNLINNHRSAINEVEEKSNELRQEIKSLRDVCSIPNLTQMLTKIATEFEALISLTVDKIKQSMDEMQQVRIKFEFESSIKDFKAKVLECSRNIQNKQGILSSISKCYTEADIHFKTVLATIPDTSDEDFLDIEHLKGKVESLQAKADAGFKKFTEELRIISNQVEYSDDSTNDTKLLFEATNLSNNFCNELDNLKYEVKKLTSFYAVTPQGKLARDVKKRARRINEVNGLQVYKLPTKMIHENTQHHFRHFTLGENQGNIKPTKIIMMVGMTGAGKSLMLNNMVNYVYGVSFQDNFRFKLISEEEEVADRRDSSTSQADSMTRWVSSYTLYYREGFRVPYTLVLIDTPGFGDTRGIDFDENIGKCLKEFFSNDTYPINELSSIGLVIQASQSRLTAEQTYVFNAVLNIFGNNVTKNICLLFTFADAQTPPALETVRKEKIPFPEEGVFKFNNSAVFAGINDESNAYYWKFGFDSLEKYFRHIQTVEPASLTLTKEVLKERETLHLLLDGLQRMISDGFETLQSIENTTRVVMELKGTMKANKDFKVKKTVHPQETKVVNHFITNCKICMFTCHDPCYIAGDNKEGCASMRDGKCVQCSGRCPWDAHANGDRIYIYTKVESEETIQEMMDKYNIALNDKGAKVKILRKLLKDYKDHKDQVFADIQDACRAATRLEEIALGKSILSSVDYINRLIDSERRSNRPNKENRIKQLQHFKERAELLSHAKTNPNMLTDKMSKYEATVMNEIQKLEEKLEEDMEIEEMESQKEKQRNNDPGLLKRGYNMFKTVIPSF